MHVRFIAFLFVLMFSAGGSMRAQTAPTEAASEKEKAAQELQKNALELMEQTIGEASALKLSENRAYVYATAGDVLWKQNEKRARQLFRDAANEIVQANAAPVEKSDSPAGMMSATFSRTEIYNLRRMLLQTLAAHDAELALELLLTTRPADVAAEMQSYLASLAAAPPSAQTPAPAQNSAGFQMPKAMRNLKAQQEIQLEQSIAARAAEQDPQKAAALIRESWSKGLSYEVMNLIYKVGAKDIELANKLLTETAQKALDADFTKKASDMNFAVSLLNTFSSARRANSNNKVLAQLKLDDKTLKDLANKVADSLLQSNGMDGYFSFNGALPVLEKIVPERAAALRLKQSELKKQMPQGIGIGEIPRSLNDPNATPETIVAESAKASPQMRPMLFRQAAYRASEFSTEDANKMRSLLQNQPQSKERDDAVATIDSNLAARSLRDGKLDDARKIIDQMALGNNKVEQIVGLAVASYRLNTKESKEAALKLMEDARQMVKDFPEDKDETDGLVKVIAGYAVIDPPRAFTMLSPVVEQANELINAGAVLAKFNKQNQVFRDGEILMANGLSQGGSKFFRYGKELKMLAQADMPRTRGLISQFRRDDVRLFVKLFIAQAVLKEQIGLSGAMYVSF